MISYDPVDGGNHMPEAKWEETCSKCIYGSRENLHTAAKGKCTHKTLKQHFDFELRCWMCASFVCRWDTKEDLEASKEEHTTY